MPRLRALGFALGVLLLATRVEAQVLGTFAWQLQPYCNVISVTITQVGALYRLDGVENRCGAPQLASVVGTAFMNPDGTLGFGFNIVTPDGASAHIDASMSLSTLGGTWIEAGGGSGTFVFTPGAAVAGSPMPARSSVVADAVRYGNYTFPRGTTVNVPLDAAKATSLSFSLASPRQLVLTYSAECAVSAGAGNNSTWLNIDVVHNGVALVPTAGTSDAFCTSNGTAGADGWERQSVTLVVPGVAGTNTIQVQANVQNGVSGNSGWLGDSALVIQR